METHNIPPPPPPPELPVVQQVIQGIDALMNKIVGAFDRVMTQAINEGGLADMVGNLAAKASDLTSSISQAAGDFSPFANKPSAPDVPVKQQAITAPEVTPKIAHNQSIADQVASAGINVASIQMAHVSEAAYVSPSATPAQAVDRSNGIGLA